MIKKNGTPIEDTMYRVTNILLKATKAELITEILSTHPWDWLLENGFVEVKQETPCTVCGWWNEANDKCGYHPNGVEVTA